VVVVVVDVQVEVESVDVQVEVGMGLVGDGDWGAARVNEIKEMSGRKRLREGRMLVIAVMAGLLCQY
jgi:hypothetical protein